MTGAPCSVPEIDDPDDILHAVIAEIHRLHGKRMIAGGNELYYALEQALKMLPGADVEWAVAKPSMTVLARSGQTLFQIALDPDEHTATLTSRPIEGGELCVGLTSERMPGDAQLSMRETIWTFRYVDQKDETDEWLRITGSVSLTNHGEEVDRLERFARDLATQAGWEPPKA